MFGGNRKKFICFNHFYFLRQHDCAVLRLVSQLCLTLCNPMDSSLPGSSVPFLPGNFPGKNTGMGCHALLQGIFPTQESNPGLLHCRRIFLHLSYEERHSNEYSGLISFRIDWFGLLTLQGTLKSLLQHHSLKASILQHPAFFCCWWWWWWFFSFRISILF